MKLIGDNLYIHKGVTVQYREELGGFIIDNSFAIFYTRADAKAAINLRSGMVVQELPRIIGFWEQDPKGEGYLFVPTDRFRRYEFFNRTNARFIGTKK